MLSNELTVHGKVLLFENVDRGRGGWVSYEFSLLAHIGGRIAKLGVLIGKSFLDACTKLGGDWVWPNGYWGSSISP